MGCISTKKQTKDEDNTKKDTRNKPQEPAPEKNGAVEITEDAKAEVEVTDQDDVHVSVPGEDEGQGDIGCWRKAALDIHNRQRTLHGVPALTLDDELNASAQKWAENIAKLDMLKHTPGGERTLNGETFGENLAYKNFSSSDQAAVDKFDPSAEDIVMMWYDECKDPGYKYGDPNMQQGTGHFTQVVWKSSARLGIGRVRVQNGNSAKLFVCGQYIPAGNFMGEYVDNVLAPQS